MTYEFSIIHKKYEFKFFLELHETRLEMYNHAAEKGCNDISNETMGIFVQAKNDYGVIFLNHDDMTDYIVMHECGHGAFNVMRIIGRKNIKILDGSGGKDEEMLLHIQTAIYRMVKEILDEIWLSQENTVCDVI